MLRLLRQHHVRVLYVGNTPNLTHVMVAFGQYVQEHVPNVARHLRAMNFPPELYAVEWFTTLFACNLPVRCGPRLHACGCLRLRGWGCLDVTLVVHTGVGGEMHH